ncbi:MAG: carboxylating nicotinate-nucleotide diphosphorylase [Acidimicrobiales bacterium]
MNHPELHPRLLAPLLTRAFEEDLGQAGDLTTDAIVSPGQQATATIAVRSPGVIAGLGVAAAAFSHFDPDLRFEAVVADGDAVAAGTCLARLDGSARTLLTVERTALNLLGRLSGIATATAVMVSAVAGTGAKIVCTRKTTPGLRALEKYAVRMGGGSNHRFGLYDAVLIKDNHIAVAGGVAQAVARVAERVGHLVKVEVEVDSLEQLDVVLGLDRVDVVLLDNFSPADLRTAVQRVGGRLVTEASGGITAATVRAVAETGVDLISIGWLTHSAPNLDVGLDF